AIAVGNTLVIASIAYFRELQSRMNVFTLSLALADFLVGVLIMPFSMLKTVHNCWFFGRWFCKIHTSLDYIFSTASILHLRVNRAKVVVMLGGCWVAPVTCSYTSRQVGWCGASSRGWDTSTPASTPCSTDSLTDHSVEHSRLSSARGFSPRTQEMWIFSVLTRFRCRQVVLNSIYPSLIVLCKKTSYALSTEENMTGRVHSQHQQQVDGNALKREYNATKTLGLIMGAFCVCWLPYCVVNVVDVFNNDQTSRWVWSVVAWLGYINSGFNPVLYGLFNRPFRRAFAIVLSKRIFTSDTRNVDLFRE
uniref:Trace amine associated receptor 1 n=1 Tax=Petromyzon marinus TaxID=7757 RepID=S4RAM5_PETMA